MIFTIMVSGTDSNAPTGPHSHPQKIKEKTTNMVERPRLRPMRMGSSQLPSTMLTPRYPKPTIRAACTSNPVTALTSKSNCTTASASAGKDARIEPIVGT